MTVIAFDGKRLVADKAASNCGYRRTVTKIHKVPGGMVGFAGCGLHMQLLLQWFHAGADPQHYPTPEGDNDHADAMFIDKLGQVWHFGCSGLPIRTYEAFDAIGSGRDYALAAMHLGQDAVEAVKVATHFDAGCGNGIDIIELAEIQEERRT